MPSHLPAIYDALLTFARANVSSATVTDGKAVSNDAGDFLMVGVNDPANRAQTAANVRQAAQYAGTQRRREDGEVFFTAESVNGGAGDDAQKAARDAVTSMLATFESALQAAPDVGITTFACEVSFGSVGQLVQAQDSNGSRATLTFKVAFVAWI